MTDNPTETRLAHITQAERALMDARTVPEAKDIRDTAQAIQSYLKQQNATLDIQNHAAELKLRAERKLGSLLNEDVHAGNPQLSHDATIGRLPDGINRNQSSRWQREASLPDDEFDAWVTRTKEAGEELTSAGLLREAQKCARADAPPPPPPLPTGVYDVIYADPPWQYSNTGVNGAGEHHYPTMPLNDIRALEVPSADNATLFLWATNPFSHDAHHVVEDWGFEYKTKIVWVKTNLQKPGVGFYVRGHNEDLFICTRGSHVPDMTGKEPISSVLMADVREHSRKPDEVYGLIEAMYPEARYLELFARGMPRNGWKAWGNEVTHN